MDLNLSVLEDAVLGHGTHNPGTKTPCFAELVNLLLGNPLSDRTSECLTRLLSVPRRLNDSRHWRDDGHRTSVMLPYVERFARCARDDAKDLQCMYALADYVVRVIAAEAMDRCKLSEQAQALRAIPPVVDRESALVARDTARKARSAADAAYYAADAAAAADAYAAADAAADAADAAARKNGAETIERHTRAMLDIICAQYAV